MRNSQSGHRIPSAIPHSSLYVPHVLDCRLGLAQAGNAVARFPLIALLEQLDSLKTLEHIPFAAQCGGRAQTAML